MTSLLTDSILEQLSAEAVSHWQSAARSASSRIPPLWPLSHFVAVNPFLGHSDQAFGEAASCLARNGAGSLFAPRAYYREQFENGFVNRFDLAAAAFKGSPEAAIDNLIAWLNEEESEGDLDPRTVAEAVDRTAGTDWANWVVQEIGKWSAGHADEGHALWAFPWRGVPLYETWREGAVLDRNPEIRGLKGFRRFVAALPEKPEAALAVLATQLGFAPESAVDCFHGALLTVRGWAGAHQYEARNQPVAEDRLSPVEQLLVIRLAYDCALLEQYDSPSLREFWPPRIELDLPPKLARDLKFAELWQTVVEHAFQRELQEKMANLGNSSAGLKESAEKPARPEVQAVFCIDVRSEVFRRAFEATSARIETIGFAGFFGMPIRYTPLGDGPSQDRCPALLQPPYAVHESFPHCDHETAEALEKTRHEKERVRLAWSSFKASAVSSFSFVETIGLGFMVKLVKAAWPRLAAAEDKNAESAVGPAPGLPASTLKENLALAEGALRNMSLTDGFAPIVLLCGHGAKTKNNPHASSLDCGACGGHAGDANARIAARLLNDPEIRSGLAERGIVIPEDTWFVAALHNTTTDDVRIFDKEVIPQSHHQSLEKLESQLAEAGGRARRERAVTFGLEPETADLDDAVRRRSVDWSEVRPEWGLAGNAALIAAPRSRTRGVDLGGRVFLHNYEASQDSDGSVLKLILNAPVVVANWINLQYYGSTVNPGVLGSGDKVIHNIVGRIGVLAGNGGDLQPGLPHQSLADADGWRHQPLRLSVVIEASTAALDQVLSDSPDVSTLFAHEWMHLFAWDPAQGKLLRWFGPHDWRPLTVGIGNEA